ncbi:Uncharacterized protein dnm_020250 [Desulfonema magnum]|uniref:Uncharacterized protein n=1 Tax=Desulfonema magnum TaxID=45655 RepID=A0A975GLQ1_9BACT|nr:Uncharacterized protein dnm_020250 [Desulfonema magnum]
MKIHFENPGFLSENIFMTGGEKPGFFMSVYTTYSATHISEPYFERHHLGTSGNSGRIPGTEYAEFGGTDIP